MALSLQAATSHHRQHIPLHYLTGRQVFHSVKQMNMRQVKLSCRFHYKQTHGPHTVPLSIQIESIDPFQSP